MMNKKSPLFGFLLLPIFVLGLIFLLTRGGNVQVLNPQGFIALKERGLIVTAVALMFSLAIPVLIMTFFIVWKYRADNTKATYTPDWTGNWMLKTLWWAILSVFVVIFSVIVWNSAHELDPYKPIAASSPPITIEVVALQWKWLFIYPKENIATVNFVEFPLHTSVNFRLTADAPMTSFWIPRLGGQIYAMSGMETQIHLLSDTPGNFTGGTTEINGAGYAGMQFTARASTQKDFDAWVKSIKKSSKPLDSTTFANLDKPSEDTPVTFYAPVGKDLYNEIITKYMAPTGKPSVHIKQGAY